MYAAREVIRHAGVQHAGATRQDVDPIGSAPPTRIVESCLRPSSFLKKVAHKHADSVPVLSLLCLSPPFFFTKASPACHPFATLRAGSEPRRGEGPAFEVVRNGGVLRAPVRLTITSDARKRGRTHRVHRASQH